MGHGPVLLLRGPEVTTEREAAASEEETDRHDVVVEDILKRSFLQTVKQDFPGVGTR